MIVEKLMGFARANFFPEFRRAWDGERTLDRHWLMKKLS
jgi:hypothetical protein